MRKLTGKHVLVSLLPCLLLIIASYSQTVPPTNEKAALTDRAAEMLRLGKLDEAIKLGKKVVELERKEGSPDSASYVNAVLNLARMKRDKFLSIRGKALGKKLERSELFSLQEQEDAAAGDAETLYREIIKISQTAGRQRSTQVADAKSELAWLITNFSPLHRPPTVSDTRTRVDESETLFSESLELNGQIRGIDADETLIVVIALGNLYLKYDNYEKALPFYERYIQAFEKKRGSKAPELVNALRPLAQIHYATFREGDSDAAIKRVEEITGRKENLPLGKLDLYSRSKDAVAHFLDRANSTQAKWVSNGGDRGVQAALKSVRVRTTIDTSGKVIEAVAETSDADLRKRAEAEVSKWFVRPFIYNGDARNLRGYLVYYDIR